MKLNTGTIFLVVDEFGKCECQTKYRDMTLTIRDDQRNRT